MTVTTSLSSPDFGSASAGVDPQFTPTDSVSSNVIDGPGTFSLDIDANGASYEIFVCQTLGQGGGSSSTPERSSEVMKETIPPKPLPPTGGWSVYALVASSILAGAGLLGFRLGIWRGRQ